jgi:zinc/manganese transport system substrate-binding protein
MLTGVSSRPPILLALLLGVAAACGGAGSPPPDGRIQVVAAENFWGSLASQLGGSRAVVQSVLSDPNADPHDYESNTNDARAFATAGLVILNGAGYDDWGLKLVAANPSSSRRVLDVADLLGKKAGDNPHFWYNPAWVVQVADRVTADYEALDPGDRSYFQQRRAALTAALQPYEQRLAEIRGKFAGTKVGATESIFVYLAQYLRLDLVSPAGFMNAVGEGNDPSAADVAAFENQISSRQIKVLVYNLQTATAVTTTLKILATQNGIPVVGVSETLQPATATFEDWQLGQLLALEDALNARALPG